MTSIDEETKQKLTKELEIVSDRIRYMDTQAMQKIVREGNVLQKEGAPGPLQGKMFEVATEAMMKTSIDPAKFDDKASKSRWFKPPFQFYTQFDSLLRRARAKNKALFDGLVEAFLTTNAMDYLSNKLRPGSMRNILLNARIEQIKKKMTGNTNFTEATKSLAEDIDEIRKEVETMIETSPDMRQAEMELHVKDIMTNYENTRYFVGLLIGLFDILSGTFKAHMIPYLNPKNSVGDIYYDSQKAREKIKHMDLRKRELIPQNNLQFFLKEPSNKDRFSALRTWFESWFFPTFKDIRIHPAHHQDDVRQDEISGDKYHVMVDGVIKSYSLADLKELNETLYQFLLWAKGTAAYVRYPNNKERVQYLTRHDFENPERTVKEITWGKR